MNRIRVWCVRLLFFSNKFLRYVKCRQFGTCWPFEYLSKIVWIEINMEVRISKMSSLDKFWREKYVEPLEWNVLFAHQVDRHQPTHGCRWSFLISYADHFVNHMINGIHRAKELPIVAINASISISHLELSSYRRAQSILHSHTSARKKK